MKDVDPAVSEEHDRAAGDDADGERSINQPRTEAPRSRGIRERSMLNRLWDPWQTPSRRAKESSRPVTGGREEAEAFFQDSGDRKLARYNNASLIRTLRQISRDKSVAVNLRVRCCEMLILIDPNIQFNMIERPSWAQDGQSGAVDCEEE
jgi:hypothetical protein